MRPFIRRNHHLRFYLTSSKVNLNCSTNEPRVPRYFYTSQLLRLSTIFQRCSRNILTPCISAIQLECAFCGDISRVKWKGRKKKGGGGKRKKETGPRGDCHVARLPYLTRHVPPRLDDLVRESSCRSLDQST